MAEAFHSAWLELAVIGLLVSVICNALLSWVQSSERCEPALARSGRAAILHGACDASESGWARVIRAQLVDAHPGVSQIYDEERARIRRVAGIGLAGTAAALVGAAALGRAQPVAMAVAALIALVVGWKLVGHERAAITALALALTSATNFSEALRRRPKDPPAAPDVPWMRVNAPAFMGLAFLAVAAIPIIGLFVEAAAPVSAGEIGILLAVHVMFFPLVLASVALRRSAWVALDGTRREVRVLWRVFGIPYARATVPLELVTGFSIDERPRPRGADVYLVAETISGPIDLVDGDNVPPVAEALARAIGAQPTKRRPAHAELPSPGDAKGGNASHRKKSSRR